MFVRNFALATAAIAVLSPALSQASPERASVKACARAFAASITGPGAEVPAYKVAFRGISSSTLQDFYPSEFTMTLEAHSAKTGAAFARATCSTNYHGVVTSLSQIPLDAKPTLASSN